MKLGLDVTYALDPHPSGVARYSECLTRALAARPEVELTLCARWPRVLRLRKDFAGLKFRACWLQEPLNVRLPGRVDLFHGLNQRLPHYRLRRQVITVHDVFPLSSETYSTPQFRARFSRMIHDAAARADRIICVSAYTRDQLCKILDVNPEFCDVIHHGVEPAAPSEDMRRKARALAGDGPFFLSVGAVQVRKNPLAAIQAVSNLPAGRLVFAGSAGHGAAEATEYVRRQHLDDRVRFTGYLEQPLLDALYAEATALLFPSLEEGFGFPVLEAMARGLAVIASNTSSIPEIAGDAAVLLDPRDVDGMARHARRMLEDQAWRDSWIARGRERARLFTWQGAAEQTLAVYRRLL